MSIAISLPICTVEIWRSVVGFEDRYDVSNLGRVRSKDHAYMQVSRGGRPYLHTKRGRILKPGIASNGYPSVVLGRKNTKMVHRLVAEAFLGLCPEGYETCHKDGDRSSPRLDNIYWGTRSENNYDRWRHYREKATHV